jgi:hypothetical protein
MKMALETGAEALKNASVLHHPWGGAQEESGAGMVVLWQKKYNKIEQEKYKGERGL